MPQMLVPHHNGPGLCAKVMLHAIALAPIVPHVVCLQGVPVPRRQATPLVPIEETRTAVNKK
jgi:hypothetical protein